MKRLFVMGLLFMFMAVMPVVSAFTAEPEVVTNSGPISSVTVAGLVEQNGTPTPTAPIDIVSNNGVLRASVNEFDASAVTNGYFYNADLEWVANSSVYTTDYMKTVKGKYTLTVNRVASQTATVNVRINLFNANNVIQSQTVIPITPETTEFTYEVDIPDGISYVRISTNPAMITITDFRNSKPIYTDGEVETIGDSANHTATVATLLGVGDYRDTQNINTGAITRNVGVKVFDGTEGFVLAGGVAFRYILDDFPAGTKLMSNYFNGDVNPSKGIAEMPDLSIKGHGTVPKNIYFKYTEKGTVEAFQRWLAEQYANGTPVIIVYPLATPTTESVTGQTMTTAPVNNRTGGVAGMTITTLLSSGASVVTTIGANAIKIATTAYNSARFSPVVTDLNSAVATIREIVTKTINQTAAIASLQADKQTRPEDACPAGKKCLLVETEENGVIVPHWFPIIEAPENTE